LAAIGNRSRNKEKRQRSFGASRTTVRFLPELSAFNKPIKERCDHVNNLQEAVIAKVKRMTTKVLERTCFQLGPLTCVISKPAKWLFGRR
jgi:hypothetical protein